MGLSLVAGALVISSGSGCGPTDSAAAEVGDLVGNITVGPLVPVERLDPATGRPIERHVPPEVYTSRRLLVLRDGAVVAEVTPDERGAFHLRLPAGAYTLTNAPSPQGRRERSDGPKPFVITPNATTTITLRIDTGIR
jgi:hypothetical protein